jgi:hypothetical protein
MRVALIVLLLLASCIVVEEPVNETVYKPTVINATKPVNVTPEIPVNVSFGRTNWSKPNIAPENVSPVYVITDLTIAQQHKMIPLLESAVRNSSCYSVGYAGFENQSDIPLKLEKQLRFEYLGGSSWKGWILNLVTLNKDKVASETAEVLVDNLSVTCLDTENFSFDWGPVRRRYEASRFY